MLKMVKTAKRAFAVCLCLCVAAMCMAAPVTVGASITNTVKIVNSVWASASLNADQTGYDATVYATNSTANGYTYIGGNNPDADPKPAKKGGIYYKADLNGFDTEIETVTLHLTFAKVNTKGTLNLYKVTSGYDADEITEAPTVELVKSEPCSYSESDSTKDIPVDEFVDANNQFKIYMEFVEDDVTKSTLDKLRIYLPTNQTKGPSLTVVTKDPGAEFTVQSTKTLYFTADDVGAVSVLTPDENTYNYTSGADPTVKIMTNPKTGTPVEDARVFYKMDLTGIAGKPIVSAKMIVNEATRKSGVNMLIYPVTGSWTPETLTYNNMPEVSATEIYKSPNTASGDIGDKKLVEYDLTSYIAGLSAENPVANIMFQATPAWSMNDAVDFYLQSCVGIEDETKRPRLEITYGEPLEAPENDVITASIKLDKGTEEAPVSANPILALYEGGNLKKVVIGDTVELTGTTTLSCAIDLTEETLTNDSVLKLFVWGSGNYIPLLKTPGVLEK